MHNIMLTYKRIHFLVLYILCNLNIVYQHFEPCNDISQIKSLIQILVIGVIKI